MIALILMSLIGCGKTDPVDSASTDPTSHDSATTDTDETDDTATTDTDTTDTEPFASDVPLTSPAEAEDLDPADGVVQVSLTAAPFTHTVDLGDETLLFDGYAYNEQTPGPTIRAQVGDTVVIELDNQLGAATTIHWHGVGVPWDMDGVTWMGSPIEDGETFTYSFTVETPGTFWYHPHFDTDEQVSGGLYGVLIVEDPDEPDFDDELIAVIDDWSPPGADSGDHLESEGPWTVNGLVNPAATFSGGQQVRLRLLNAASAGYAYLQWPEMRVIGGDQGLLASVSEPETLLLATGDRAEAELLVGESGFTVEDLPYTHRGGESSGDAEPMFRVEVESPTAPPEPLALAWSEEAPSEDPSWTDITWVFSGSLVTGDWMMNGEIFPDVSIPEVSLGEEVIVEVRNLSPTEHPFHLHGVHFEVLSVGGVQPERRTIEDTVNVPIHEVVRLKVLADNQGDWMAHCHILPHAEGGMMTVLRILEP